VKRKSFAAIVMLGAVSAVAISAQSANPAGAWLQLKTKWNNAPRKVNLHEQYSQTSVLFFDDQRHFVLLECTVLRDHDRWINVSHGDAQGIFVGEWDGQLPGKVKFRVVEKTVHIAGETYPGPWQEEKIDLMPDGNLRFRGDLYQRNDALISSVKEDVGGILANPSY